MRTGEPACCFAPGSADTTDRERAGIALHFLNGDCIPEGYFHPDDRMKHPFLSGPQADGGLSAYGARIAGTWLTEVERVLML